MPMMPTPHRLFRLLLPAIVLTAMAAAPKFATAQESDAPPPVATTLETTATSNAYTTFMMIGTLADVRQHDVYSDDQLSRLAGDLAVLCEATSLSLQELDTSQVSDSQRSRLSELAQIHALLGDQASAFQDYLAGTDDTALERYTAAREEVWPRIRNLFGTEEAAEKAAVERNEVEAEIDGVDDGGGDDRTASGDRLSGDEIVD